MPRVPRDPPMSGIYVCRDCDLPPDTPPESTVDAQTSSGSSSTHQLSFCMGQSTLQGKKVAGHWEGMGKARLIIRIYGLGETF